MSTRDATDQPVLARSDRELARLRDDFLLRLQRALDRPTRFTEHQGTDEPILCWRDADDALNCVLVRATMQPSDARPGRPLLPRVHVNHWVVEGRDRVAAQLDCDASARPRLRLQLTALPRELADFAAWVAALVRVADGLEPLPIPAPPHPCHFGTPDHPVSRVVWSAAAWEVAERVVRRPPTWHVGGTPPMRPPTKEPPS